MGNVSSLARASTGLDSYVAELGNDLSYDRSLSSSRFLKTILARHVKGPLVLKIFIKPDPGMSLRVIQRRLKIERDTLADLPNIHTSQAFVETDKAGYLIRQWSRYNLYDRISTHPYLATLEKKWIAFQLITGLRDARSRKIAHGDVKSENILVTSDLTVLITDFSTAFKPTFLPLDDPSDFSFFFDTSGRRTCYLAPERFFSSNSHVAKARQERDKDADQWGKRDGKVTESMDVFSAGCVLLEMWTEGRGVFSLSDLYAYREGALPLDSLLDGLEDSAVKALIQSMLDHDPERRPTFERLLTAYRGTVFPEYFFTFFADYCLSLSETSRNSDESPADHTIRRLFDEWDSIKVNLARETSEDVIRDGAVDESSPALLLLNLVSANARNCVWPTTRMQSLQLFQRLAAFMTDEDVINRVVPLAVSALSDDTASVRTMACDILSSMVRSISSITPQNAFVIPEYILPSLKALTVDTDVNVRCVYARNLASIAAKAVEVLEMAVALRLHGQTGDDLTTEVDFEVFINDIVAIVEDHASALLIDPSSQVKRVMLSTVTDLCLFFGRRKSNDFILSHIMTYLNDRDWALRYAFFEAIVGVGAFLGHVSIEEYVLPLMLQALADPEETVTVRVIGSLSSLASLGLFPRGRLWDLCHILRPFLVHPNTWIRHGVAGFMSAAAANLPPTDVWCILYPSIRGLLLSDVKLMTGASLLESLRLPLSRSAFNSAKVWAGQDSTLPFWRHSSESSQASGRIALLKNTLRASTVTPAMESYLAGKGLPANEMNNLEVLKDAIIKQTQSYSHRPDSDSASELAKAITSPSVSLTGLGVTPTTVFINPRIVGVDQMIEPRKLGRMSSIAGTSSRRSSFASKAKSDLNPLEEIRKRLAMLEHKGKPGEGQASVAFGEGLEAVMPQAETSRHAPGSADLAPLSTMGKRAASESVKAAPAVGAVHTVVQGMVHSSRRDSDGAYMSSPAGDIRSSVTPTKASANYTSTYDGRDRGVKALLDQIDLDNYRQPMINFGPRITSSSYRRKPSLRSSSVRSTSQTDRGATLIAHLSHHASEITCFATSPDNLFFASGSSDKTVCIWDSARLERSVSAKPRLIYHGFNAPVTAMCTIDSSHCLAAAAADGSVHILRVHVTVGSGSPKYSRVEALYCWSSAASDAIVSITPGSQSTALLVVSTSGLIATLDMRSWSLKTQLQQPLAYGPITAICTDKTMHWVLVGSATGHMSLWDLRFGLLVKHWRASAPVVAMRLQPGRGRGRWVAVAVRSASQINAVEVHDIESSLAVELYHTGGAANDTAISPSSQLAAADDQDAASTSAAVASLASEVAGESRSLSGAVLAIVTGEALGNPSARVEGQAPLSPVLESSPTPPANGWMIAAGEDRAIRLWDLGNVCNSVVICGSAREREAQFSQTSTASLAVYTAEPMRPSTRASSSRARSQLADAEVGERGQATPQSKQLLRPHYDAVCALGTIETPYSSCLLSGDRSGVMKVWRLEGVRS